LSYAPLGRGDPLRRIVSAILVLAGTDNFNGWTTPCDTKKTGPKKRSFAGIGNLRSVGSPPTGSVHPRVNPQLACFENTLRAKTSRIYPQGLGGCGNPITAVCVQLIPRNGIRPGSRRRERGPLFRQTLLVDHSVVLSWFRRLRTWARDPRERARGTLSPRTGDVSRYALGCSSPAISVENSKSALSPYLASN